MPTRLLLLSCLFLLSACSQTSGLVWQTMDTAFRSQDAQIDSERVATIPYASQALRIDDGPRAMVILAWAENQTLKWVTQDLKMVATRNGRIVKTLGFADNLLEVHLSEPDPLSSALKIKNGQRWHFEQGWNNSTGNHYAALSAHYQWQGTDELTILGESRNCRLLTEQIFNQQGKALYTQKYWVDSVTGVIQQSEQVLHPDGAVWSLTQLKPYAS